jgi:hypothetical protein
LLVKIWYKEHCKWFKKTLKSKTILRAFSKISAFLVPEGIDNFRKKLDPDSHKTAADPLPCFTHGKKKFGQNSITYTEAGFVAVLSTGRIPPLSGFVLTDASL